MFDFFVKVIDGENYLTTAGTITLCILLGLILVVAAFFTKKGTSRKMGTKQLAFCGISMALALITSYLEFFSLPLGGSITFMSMFFICFIGYLYGAKVSIPAAIAYGLLQLVIKPYMYHPVQVLLDYPLAFGALGLSGFFYKKKYGLIKGYVVGIVGRWIISSLSGYVFFAEYAPEGWNPILYTLTYNGSYIFLEGILTVILIAIPVTYRALGQIKKMACEA